MVDNKAEYLELFNAAFRYINLPDGKALFISEMTEKNYSSEAIIRAYSDAEKDTPSAFNADKGGAGAGARVKSKFLSEITRKERVWLYENVFLSGALNSIQGVPQGGKSYLLSALAAAVSNGGKLPTVAPKEAGLASVMTTVKKGRVLWITDEEVPSDVAERIEDLGGDLGNIAVIDEDEIVPNIESDELANLMAEHEPALMVVDTLMAVMPDVNINAANEVRQAFSRILRLARQYDTAVLFIQHVNKASVQIGGGHSVFYGVGSGAINGLFRTVWTLAIITDDNGNDTPERVLIKSKSNYAKGQLPAIRFSLSYNRGFQWGEVDYDIGQNDLFGKRAIGRPNRCEAAKAFIGGFLGNGMKPTAEVMAAADKAGFKRDLFYKAAKEMGVEYERVDGVPFMRIVAGL
jgi:hypothetical protein